MKNITYAICGTVLVMLAVLLRVFAAAGIELVLLVVLGITLLIASADLTPSDRRVR